MFWHEVGRLAVTAGYVVLGLIAATVLAILVAFFVRIVQQGRRQ